MAARTALATRSPTKSSRGATFRWRSAPTASRWVDLPTFGHFPSRFVVSASDFDHSWVPEAQLIQLVFADFVEAGGTCRFGHGGQAGGIRGRGRVRVRRWTVSAFLR